MTLPVFTDRFYEGLWSNKRHIGKQEKHEPTQYIRSESGNQCKQWMKCGRSPSKSANHWYKPTLFKSCFNRKNYEQLHDIELFEQMPNCFNCCGSSVWLGGLSQSQARTTEFVMAQALSKQAAKCLRKLAVVRHRRPSGPGASNSLATSPFFSSFSFEEWVRVSRNAGEQEGFAEKCRRHKRSISWFTNISQETFHARESVVRIRSGKPRRKQFLAA